MKPYERRHESNNYEQRLYLNCNKGVIIIRKQQSCRFTGCFSDFHVLKIIYQKRDFASYILKMMPNLTLILFVGSRLDLKEPSRCESQTTATIITIFTTSKPPGSAADKTKHSPVTESCSRPTDQIDGIERWKMESKTSSHPSA